MNDPPPDVVLAPAAATKAAKATLTDAIGTSAHSASSSKSSSSKAKPKMETASFRDLFQFADNYDIVLFVLGTFFAIISSATMPAINVVFGDVVDAIAEPVNVEALVNKAVRGMALLGVYGFTTFFLSFWLCGMAAGNIANKWRMKYLERLLIQDMTFFDTAEPGSLTLMLSDSAMSIQSGLAEKYAQAIQGFFQFFFGFAIAFYFGPLLALVLLACVPFLGLITTAMFMWGSEDGIFGKAAYETASTVANEAMSNIRTVISLNAEPTMSKRYDDKLGDSEKASIRQGTRNAILTGLLFMTIFIMYGIGFWYGATLIADSINTAMADHPPPDDLLDPDSPWYTTIILGCQSYLEGALNGDIEPLQVCACGLPWASITDTIAVGPNCGCGYTQTEGQEDIPGVLSGCMSGGRVMMVFFSVLIGGFSAGQIGPGIKAIADAKMAAGKMLQVIERTPTIGDDDETEDGMVASKHMKGGAAGYGGPGEPSPSKPKKRLKLDDVNGEITMANVHFRYASGSEPDQTEGADDVTIEEKEVHTGGVVFGGCNLTIKAGETVALVGESGCGKSTIAKLCQRFYDPNEGSISLDGTDLRDINLTDLRSCIGVVSQEPLLFDTTIEANIRFGKSDASFEDIVVAAQAANAHDFIMSFPDGYQTMVGARGGKLSGGQKQRVAIARAVLRKAPIMILDEATSALDNKSEMLVQQALDKLIQDGDGYAATKKRTIIVIAHRLSTVRNADKIVVLGSPEGTSTAVTGSVILEQGSHDELMNLEKGFYRALVGTGQGSSGLVDDTKDKFSVDYDGTSSANEAKLMRDRVDAAAEKNESNTDTESVRDEEKKGGLGAFFAKKDDKEAKKAAEEKKRLAKNKARVWTYTKPEFCWIVFGASASIIKGMIFPVLSIVFTRMIVVWYDSDTDYMVSRSLQYSFFFYGLALLSFITEAIQKSTFEMIGERLTKRLRADLFRSILRQDVAWFEDEPNAIGVLASRLSTDVKHVRLVAGQSVASTLECASSLTTGFIIAAFASWEMFLIMLAMVPALGTAEALQFTAMKSSEGAIRDQLSKSTDKLHETVTGIREVQSFMLQQIVIKDIEKRIDETISPASKKSSVIKGVMMGMIQLIQFLVYAFAFWFGGQMIESRRITFEDFNQALWAMAFAASGLGQAALFAGDLGKASAAVSAIFGTLDNVSAIDSAPWENNGVADLKKSKPIVRELPNNRLQEGKIELVKVNFAYPTRKTAKVFDQIDLQIPAGKVVALVGSSGSGKSTVVQLLERFYDPISYKEGVDGDDLVQVVVDSGKLAKDDGIVQVDNKDIRSEDIRWLRSNMGYVGQEPVLFNDTVYNNIALGRDNCTKEEVIAAAKHANAYDFIMSLEHGFDTMVGVGGGKISGGQKQRVAIARAVLRDAPILILDEATSALDNESEKIVQASLDKLVRESGGRRTTIIIAHRLSTIRTADCICVLENNGDGSRVVEMGSHDELIALGQKYKALVSAYENH